MVFLFLNSDNLFSQHFISGIIIDNQSNEKLPFVNILIKNNENTILSYTTCNENGTYLIEFPSEYDEIIIETSILSHKSSLKKLQKEKISKKTYIVDFELEETISTLEEVIVKSKKPILIKNDTTVFRPNNFKDGTERDVEDLLRKLPGINIAKNGSITFKGKRVTRVLLDNDNLFDDNYTIGTRNIDPEIIEEIEAIEDYQKNPLLKGIKNTEDVALNLTLKKGKTDVSGDINIGLGVENKYRLMSNILSISKKIKGFGLLNYNNINQNVSPYNFVSNNFDLSKINELRFRTNNYLASNNFNALIPEEYIGSNNNLFGSFNVLNKFSNKTSLRINANYLTDNLELNNTTKTNFNNIDLSITNIYDQNKKPKVNVLDYELIHRPKQNSILNVKGKIDYTTLDINSFSTNNNSVFREIKKSEDLFINQNIEYTNKLNNNSAFQIVGNLSKNTIPQELDFNNIDVTSSGSINQDAKFIKNSFNISSKYLSKLKNGNYSLSLGIKNENNLLTSNNDIVNFNHFSNNNDVTFRDNNLYFDFNYLFKINKWRFVFENSLFYSDVKINNNSSSTKNKKIINNPSLTTYLGLTKHSNIYINYNINNRLPELDKMYSGLIQIGNRSILSNTFEFNRIRSENVSVGYKINDFYNLFQFNSYFNYAKVNYDYLNTLFIEEDTSLNITNLEKLDNSNYRLGIETEKYINFIKSTIDLKSTLTINNYKNTINNNDIRDNKSQSLLLKLDIRTGFNNKLNFENSIVFQNNSFSTEGLNQVNFSTFQNNFSTKFVNDRFNFTMEAKYFDSNLKTRNNSFTFLDAIFNYVQKNEKIEYELQFNNLLNKKFFEELNSTDYSTTLSTQTLLERYFLLSIRFKI